MFFVFVTFQISNWIWCVFSFEFRHIFILRCLSHINISFRRFQTEFLWLFFSNYSSIFFNSNRFLAVEIFFFIKNFDSFLKFQLVSSLSVKISFPFVVSSHFESTFILQTYSYFSIFKSNQFFLSKLQIILRSFISVSMFQINSSLFFKSEFVSSLFLNISISHWISFYFESIFLGIFHFSNFKSNHFF